MQAYIIGMILIVSLIVGGQIALSPKISNEEITPSPTLELIPTHEPTPTNKPLNNNQIKGSSTVTSNSIDCIGPDEKQFKTSMSECKSLNEKWGKPVNYMINCNYAAECGGGTKYIKKSECDKPCIRITNGSNNQNANNSNYPPCTIYYPNLDFSQTYYNTSPEDCIFWKNKAKENSATTQSTSISIPTTTQSSLIPTQRISQAEIDKCKTEVSNEYQNLLRGCYIKFQGSAADACAREYQSLSATQKANCEKYGTRTPIDGNIYIQPTPTCGLTPYGCY